MMDLGREARDLLDAAAGANAAPAATRHRARKRLLGALAAGTVTTSAMVAKGAWLAAKTASVSAAPVGTSTSLAATLVSAVVIGLSTGLVAVSPTSQVAEPLPTVTAQVPVARAIPTQRAFAPSASRSAPAVQATPAVPPDNTTPLVVEPHRMAPASTAPQPEVPSVAAPTPASTLEVATPNSPTKASIARETELLAEVQRALKGGHALKALYILDRHAEDFPRGQLYEEATASRVVALCSVGRVRDGRRWTEEFLRRYPNSPLSSRVRAACAQAAARPGSVESSNE